jgi:hypothetical protein
VVWNSALEQLLEMVFVKRGQGLRRNAILASIAPPRDRCLEPPLFDPARHFTATNVQHLCQGCERKAVATDFTNTELPSMERVPEGLWASVQPLGDFLDGMFREQFTRLVQFFLVPATVIDLRLDAVLDHKTPAFFLCAAGLTLEPANELRKFAS